MGMENGGRSLSDKETASILFGESCFKETRIHSGFPSGASELLMMTESLLLVAGSSVSPIIFCLCLFSLKLNDRLEESNCIAMQKSGNDDGN